MEATPLNQLHDIFRINLANYVNYWLERVQSQRLSVNEYRGLLLAALNTIDDLETQLVSQIETGNEPQE